MKLTILYLATDHFNQRIDAMKKAIFYPLFAVVMSFLLLTACSKDDDAYAIDDLVRQTAWEYLQEEGGVSTLIPPWDEARVMRGHNITSGILAKKPIVSSSVTIRPKTPC